MEIPIIKSSNEASLGIATPSETPKSVESITSELANQYAGTGNVEESAKPRKKRSDAGVPRGSRKNLGNGSSENKAQVTSDNGQAVGFTIDKAIVEKTALTIFHTVDGLLVRRVGQTVIAIGGDVNLAKEFACDCGLTPGESQMMAELTGVIFEKHGLLTGYAPEILLTVLLGQWIGRVGFVMKRLSVMVEEVKRTKKNVSSSSPNQNSDNGQKR